MEEKTFDISWQTIFKLVFVFFLFYLVYLVKDVLILFLFGLVIALLFENPIRFLEKKIPRVLATIVVYFSFFLFLSSLIYFSATAFVNEIKEFVNRFPLYFEQLSPVLRALGFSAFENLESFVESIEETVMVSASHILSALFSIFGGIATTLFVLSVAIFFSLEGKNIEKVLVLFFPRREEDFIVSLWRGSQKKIGLWFLTSLVSCFSVALLLFVGLFFLKARYPLLLSLIGGVLNFIPIIGSFFAVLLIFIVLALESLPKAIIGFSIFLVVQQIDNNIVVPLVSKKLIRLSPILILFSLAVGGELGGFLGAILGVPVVAMMAEFLKGILEKRRDHMGITTSE